MWERSCDWAGITGLSFINQNRDDEILDGEGEESAADKKAAPIMVFI
jgi:hypothetical protein